MYDRADGRQAYHKFTPQTGHPPRQSELFLIWILICIVELTSLLAMRIDVIFDTICPWCYLGKKRLEQSLLEKPHLSTEISWHPFMLNPDLPPEGLERRHYLNAKFGNEDRSDRVYQAISEAGRSLGIDFQFDRITRTPNTLDSHRLVRFVQTRDPERSSEVVETLFHAYFLRGLDTGNRTVLYDLVRELGYDVESLRSYLYSDEDVEDIRQQNARIHRISISGVPAFIIDGQFSISGAQEPRVIGRLLEIAEERRRETFNQDLQINLVKWS